MQVTFDIDSALYAKAFALSGLETTSEVCRAGIIALIERESARRLIALGGSDPKARTVSRRRSSAKQ